MAQGGVVGKDMSLLQGKAPGDVRPAPSLGGAGFYSSMSLHSQLPIDVFQVFLQDLLLCLQGHGIEADNK